MTILYPPIDSSDYQLEGGEDHNRVATNNMIATSSGIIFNIPITAINNIATASGIIFSVPIAAMDDMIAMASGVNLILPL
jgi:hypothetical protein